MDLKEYSQKFECDSLIFGPNWLIVKPSEEEIKITSESEYYHSDEKQCILCNCKFSYGQSQKIICGKCKVFVQCNSCEEYKEYLFCNHSGSSNNYIINQIQNDKNIKFFCSKSCSNNSRHSYGICPFCKHEDIDIYNGRCSYCANKELNVSINCLIHGYQKTSFGGLCIVCHNQTEEMKEQARQLGLITGPINAKKLNKYYEKYCDICSKITIHNGFDTCGNCKPGILGCISLFKEQDGNRFYYDKIIKNYILWNDYKKKFQFDVINYTNFIEEIKEKYPQTFLQTTFRPQDSIDWNGSKGAFEQNLVEKGINWFVYIKFYIDKDKNIKHLVVGKSGSLLVNYSGSDVSFSTCEDHGSARKFLLEENLDWDKTKIAIISCQNEIYAFITEYNIALDFNLFES